MTDTEVTWEGLLHYMEMMTFVTLAQCNGDPVAVAMTAFLAGNAIQQNEPELGAAIRHVLEARIAKEQGITAEQVEVAIKEAFGG